VRIQLQRWNTLSDSIRYGKVLVERYETFKGAKREIDERILLIQSHVKSTNLQITFIEKVWSTLDDEHQTLQLQILQVLVSKLQNAISQIQKVEKKKPHSHSKDEGANPIGEVKRWRYMLYLKESLDKAIEELEAWHKKFDPSWFLIMKIADPVIDTELARHDAENKKAESEAHVIRGANASSSFSTAHYVRDALKDNDENEIHIFRRESGLSIDDRHDISYSTAKLVKRSDSTKWVILDSQECDPDIDIEILTKDVRNLARKLHHADPLTFNLLACSGVIRVPSPDRKKLISFDFVFKIPEGMSQPTTLRNLLLTSPKGEHSLSDRFRIARQLAKSVSYIHMYDFVHKNIRPETVLVLKDQTSDLGSLFLTGFKSIRRVDGRTYMAGDAAWEKNLYRHPQRQGLHPDQYYTMQHDIYSLGVSLLEIGLWESFVNYNDDPSPSTALTTYLKDPDFKNPALIKDSFTALAKEALPQKMGNKYTEIVVTCLTCLDKDNVHFGDESDFRDQDDVLVGVRYIDNVSTPIHTCLCWTIDKKYI
jgi:hypothetical protein